jgi:hypothetical protein
MVWGELASTVGRKLSLAGDGPSHIPSNLLDRKCLLLSQRHDSRVAA